jgi:HlyD family secretion protein
MSNNNTTGSKKLFEGIGDTSGMDKPVSKEFRKRKIIIRYTIIGFAVTAVILVLIFMDKGSKLNVELDKITIEEVKKDIFQDYISIIGTVEPIQTVYLDATEGGRVEEIYLREGTMVKRGDAIMRLSNDNLVLEISNNEAEVARAINDLKSMRVTLENQQISNRSQLVDYYYDLLKLERDYKKNNTLIKNNYISQEDYQLSKENYERKKKLYELLSKKAYQDSISITTRIASSEEMVESLQNNLNNNRNRLKKLTIKAPVDGELATLTPELGKVITYGTSIGSINILDSYKVKADIDEHYIDRVKLKLKSFCEFSNKDYQASITKIYPEVKNGQFSVDMVFTNQLPSDLRIGQTTRIRLELGESETSIIVPRGGFYQTTGGQWIFVVKNDEKSAIKRIIKIGRQNPNYYEILEGLEPGEKVITSGYESFGDAEKLVLKK